MIKIDDNILRRYKRDSISEGQKISNLKKNKNGYQSAIF